MKFRSIVFVISLIVVGIIITGVAIGQEGQGPEPESPSVTDVATIFTYQGQLKSGGSGVNGKCDFQFELWSAPTGGGKIGSTLSRLNVDVVDGRFVVELDFGGSAFNGDSRWLLIKVRCPAGSGTYTTLTPRQRLTAAPYALYANSAGSATNATNAANVPWSGVTSKPAGFADGTDNVNDNVSYSEISGIVGTGATNVSQGNHGHPWSAVIAKPAGFADDVDNVNDNVSYSEISGIVGRGSSRVSQGNHDHLDQTWTGTDVPLIMQGEHAFNAQQFCIFFICWWEPEDETSGAPLILRNDQPVQGSGLDYELGAALRIITGTYGIYVDNADWYGIWSNSENDSDESGTNFGVYGRGYNNYDGGTGYAYGLYGYAYRNGLGEAIGVYGYAGGAGGATAWAGYFNGDINVTGSVLAPATTYQIDHPLDPENSYLNHSAVESSDSMNIYNGNIALDQNGEGWVEMPEWFEALNIDYRYQLTAIGAPGPNLYVAEKIQNNRFKIAGGEPGTEVSWQVTGIRNDAYTQANNIQVEQAKPEHEQGLYRHPEAFGQPAELGIDFQTEESLREQEQLQERSSPEELNNDQ